ncbi:putative deoxyribonuclease TATDN1 [Orchesella cincta]|uniref:Deoxyribonuclease TATDN1 n=1 Tax=Orchesella cincta TaxID=48709 RepID=A0A1D2NA11_ORCCI|nr:putative deoxyribonuclease TATDN1 [Orchesella cincta]
MLFVSLAKSIGSFRFCVTSSVLTLGGPGVGSFIWKPTFCFNRVSNLVVPIGRKWSSETGMADSTAAGSKLRLIDVGANLTDDMYSGMYNGSKKHEPDLDKVLDRAWAQGVDKIFVTAGNLEEAKRAVNVCKENDRLWSTVGVHPTRCSEFDTKSASPDEYIKELKAVLESSKGKIVALGEFGLDYERTQFCDVETQKKYFTLQLTELGAFSNLPLFLHCRAAAKDLHDILSANRNCFPRGGVVHSFDGTLEELNLFLELGLYIGINGCSLKTEENCKVVQEIPIDRLLLETDAPWCGIRPSHASSKFIKTKFDAAKKNWSENTMYKSRNEPQTLRNVLEAVAGIKELNEYELAETVYENTIKLFMS